MSNKKNIFKALGVILPTDPVELGTLMINKKDSSYTLEITDKDSYRFIGKDSDGNEQVFKYINTACWDFNPPSGEVAP